MNPEVVSPADRRRALIADSDRNRVAMAAAVEGLERKLFVVDRVVAAARRLHRHRGLLGAAAVALVLVPLAARKWVTRAVWWAPFALEAYRLARNVDWRGARSRRGERAPDNVTPA